MSEGEKRLSVLAVEVSQELVERFAADVGFHFDKVEAHRRQADAIKALNGPDRFDVIIIPYDGPATGEGEWLRLVRSLDHRKQTPVVMLTRRHGADFNMSNKKAETWRLKKRGFTDNMKGLIASALADKVGYLRVEDFPNTSLFDDLPSRAYGPHKIIRCQMNELFVVTRGLIEVWHPHHDMLVKKLTSGALFGDMPLLGQTMVITQAVASDAGATVAVMDVERVRKLIKANGLSIAERLYPRLASIDLEHYRANFQMVDSRLAALLLELAGEGSTIEGITQQEMGERIGLARETVSVALAAMKVSKLITIDRKKTTLLDRKALEALSRM